MRQWVKKLVQQFEVEKPDSGAEVSVSLSEDRATILYLLDVYSKNLFETDKQPVRKVREIMDGFVKELMTLSAPEDEKSLFRLRQFFASYRIEEYSYLQKTFDDFKTIIWDFADQLGEELQVEKKAEADVGASLAGLREAVESNSIEDLRAKSREFINFYISHQTKKDDRRAKRMSRFRKNLDQVRKQLVEANQSMRTDHMTGAFNRKSFDEQVKNHLRLGEFSGAPVTLILADIDHFKKINDSYGHDIGDFVIKECVNMLKGGFHEEQAFVARIGGEEFAILLTDCDEGKASQMAETLMGQIRKEVFVQGNLDIRFTISMGIAEARDTDSSETWLKRADEALYHSKHSGRNRWTTAKSQTKKVA
ncbi:MAG TPA: GGDEF domain-containing protein [Pseudobdellovibrionaceae bacterium]|nr:GGDEF domain-containing protein [Pseudobdellovibrionaceae bacterium]